jgi:hypothetical protein
MDADAIADWIASCRKPSGGYGGSPRQDAHLLYTLSAVQGLALLGRLDSCDADSIASCERVGGSRACRAAPHLPAWPMTATAVLPRHAPGDCTS